MSIYSKLHRLKPYDPDKEQPISKYIQSKGFNKQYFPATGSHTLLTNGYSNEEPSMNSLDDWWR
jgi:hypothetical protein